MKILKQNETFLIVVLRIKNILCQVILNILQIQNKRKFDHYIQEASDNFDLYYISQKLKYSCEILNRKSILSVQYELKFINELINYLKDNPPDHVPAISIYNEILFMLLYPENKRHFFKLNLLLHKHSHLFPPKESKDMYTFALNHCVKRINMGHSEFNKELFELYKVMIEKRIIFNNDGDDVIESKTEAELRHAAHWRVFTRSGGELTD